MPSSCRWVLFIYAFFMAPCWAKAQSEHGFVNTKPSGQPYLSPEESRKRMKVPDGFEVTVFAAEPDIINPISFTVDERGRLWVVECYEYPKRTQEGKKPRDRIKILEDTTGAGKANKVTVWAEGKDLPRFDLASGIEVGHGGVFLGAAPYLFFLQDTTGSGHCDRHEILLQGFHSEDTHEVLNTLQWGPDGRLYGLHGIFTQSKIGDVQMNAAVWRYDVRAKKFEIFAEGTSNPWGLDFDSHGQAFLAACVIPHCYHIIPGGTYIRQAGSSMNPYAYGLLHEISDHTHHKESGWAHAGVLALEGNQVPAEYRGSLLMGSIHGCSIKRDILERKGSTFVAHHGPDFLVSGDKNFRPINMRWGPDGSIYVIDWHDQNPCHQALPDSWDMTHGRIYNIQRKNAKRPELPGDLNEESSERLVDMLMNDSPWWYRTAIRILGERRDRSVKHMLRQLFTQTENERTRLRYLWALHAIGGLDEEDYFSEWVLNDKSPWIRAWAVRLLGERGKVSRSLFRFVRMARKETAPEVRLQLASTAQRLTQHDTIPLLHALMLHKEDATDPCIPLMLWLAYEPRVAVKHDVQLDWLAENAAGNPLVTNEIVPRTLRRLVATHKPEDLEAAVSFLTRVQDGTVRRLSLEGLLAGMETQQIGDPPAAWKEVFTELLKDPHDDVKRLARRLAVRFNDLQALRQALALALDAHKPSNERMDALHDLAAAHPADALQPLQQLLAGERDPDLRCEVIRTLAAYDRPEIAGVVLTNWKDLPGPVRVEAVNLLAGRKSWARELLTAVGQKQVQRTDLNDNTILRIRALRDKGLNDQIEAVWGRVREKTPAELNALIERMRGELSDGKCSSSRGQAVFENQCAKCHRFEGKGHDVGPNLDGAARDIDYLLVNILDPNRVVGQPYYTRFVELKSGRLETGLLAAEDMESVTLKAENDALKVILKKDIQEMTVQEKSLMPEGLNKNMSVQDFRDLVRYLMANPFLTEVSVAGPFTPAEVRSRLGDTKDLSQLKKLTWTEVVTGPPGRIPLPPPRDKGETVAFFSAKITSPTKMRTRLQLGSANPVQIALNGKLLYNGKPANGATQPDQAGVNVDLPEGTSDLVFEVHYQGAKEGFFARFLDPQRRLSYSVK
jgi:putative membrane-bound dehydrogenase-like protein